MRYKDFIEKNFLIDEPKTGKLVPFIFRPVQKDYYNKLVQEYDIEKNGLTNPVREIILKARREGFSSLILALFAADDILSKNPTETLVISYRDDATDTFRKRYRNYVLSAAARFAGATIEQIQTDPGILDKIAPKALSIDSNEIEIRHNKAHFYCGTASARVGGRGGVLQKLLFSEEAHYPDSEKMAAREIIDGTLRQIDIDAGWVFRESTANGYGNYYEQTWTLAEKKESRFKPRFYGWRDMYTQAEYDLIASEFTEKHMLKQEYPENPEEAFISSGIGYFDNELILEYIKTESREPLWIGDMVLSCTNSDQRCVGLEYCPHLKWEFLERKHGKLKVWEKPDKYSSFVLSADVAEGVEGDNSVADVMNNRTMQTVATFADNQIDPGDFGKMLYALGKWYNDAYIACEVNKDGLYTNDILLTMSYPSLHFREEYDDVEKKVKGKVGFKTDAKTRPFILSGLLNALTYNKGIWVDKEFLNECLVFVRKDGKPQAMTGKHDDRVITKAIGLEVRSYAPKVFATPDIIPKNTAEENVLRRLEMKKLNKHGGSEYSQERFY